MVKGQATRGKDVQQVPDEETAAHQGVEAKEVEEPGKTTLPLPTGVQQVVEARKKVEAAVREEADSQESELSSATQEPRVEPQ